MMEKVPPLESDELEEYEPEEDEVPGVRSSIDMTVRYSGARKRQAER